MVAGDDRLGEQLGFFDEPEPEKAPVPKAPTAVKPSTAKVKYADLSARTWNCVDCEQLVYEQLMENGISTHLIRKARVKRTQGTVELVLCFDHATHRQEQETLALGKGR